MVLQCIRLVASRRTFKLLILPVIGKLLVPGHSPAAKPIAGTT